MRRSTVTILRVEGNDSNLWIDGRRPKQTCRRRAAAVNHAWREAAL
jgi:hypothetical protein